MDEAQSAATVLFASIYPFVTLYNPVIDCPGDKPMEPSAIVEGTLLKLIAVPAITP
jgi:hypothetical protein